jgi:hypothetical protein
VAPPQVPKIRIFLYFKYFLSGSQAFARALAGTYSFWKNWCILRHKPRGLMMCSLEVLIALNFLGN